jgi:hypothetical protein
MKRPATKKPQAPEVHEMKPEYDFSQGVRGKHAARFAKGTNVVVLDPDVAKVFRDSESVNETLRALLPILARRRKRVVREEQNV